MKNGWQTKKLGELSEIELGKTPARANKSYWDEKRETGNVWLSIADLLNAEDKVVVDSKEYLSDKGVAISKNVRKGTLLVSFKLTLGRLAFAGRDLFTNEAIAALTIFDERALSKEFLFYFLHFFDWVKAAENDVKLKGMTFNKAKLKEMPVHFPTLPEQRRIVGILDEAFAGIATAKRNAEKNLQNARALFESHLNAVFTQRGEGWVEKPLGAIAELIDSLHKTPTYIDAGGFPMVRVTDVRDGVLNLQNCKRVDKDAFDEFSRRHKPRVGDMVLSRVGSYGVPALVETDEPFCLGQNTVFVLSQVNSRLVYHFLKSPTSREQIDKMVSGTTQPTISLKSIKRIVVPIPPEPQQKPVVAKIEAIASETQRLESIYQRKLAALDELKKSLLHQAFSGEL